MLTATVIRARQDNAIQSILQDIIEGARPAWQRSALMRGAEVALLEKPFAPKALLAKVHEVLGHSPNGGR